MGQSSSLPVDPDAASGSASVEQLCQKFLEGWQQGKPKRIEKFLAQVSAVDRQRLLRGLLIVELRCRRKAGAQPQPAEYEARFPEEGALISQVFEMVPPARQKMKDRPADEPPTRPQNAAAKSAPKARPADAHRDDSAPTTGRQKKVTGAPRSASRPVEAADPDDEFASLLPARESKLRVPPPVVGKKKKKDKSAQSSSKKRRNSESQPAIEFLIPLGLAILSLVITLVVAIFNSTEGMPVSWYVGYKLGFTLVSTIVTTLALFAAAALLDTDYGYISSGILKIVAIVLTQGWVGDLAGMIPIPFVGGIIAWLATFFMFVSFFELDHIEAIRSMVIVRVAHTLTFWLLFAGFLSWVLSGGGGHGDDGADGGGAGVMDLLEGGAGGLKPAAADIAAATRFRTLTQKFGDALLAQEYATAYEMMSPGYQAVTSLDDFSAIHRKALADYGKPLKCEAGIGTLDRAELKEPEFAHFTSVPAESRRAWTYAAMALELDGGEMERCYECWLMFVESGDGFRIAGFEYAWCD